MWEPLLRNVYHSDDTSAAAAKRLALYVKRCDILAVVVENAFAVTLHVCV